MEEIWKDVVEYEGLYQVSNFGKIKSLDRIDCVGRKIKGKILSAFTLKNGYLVVHLCKNGVKKTQLVHVLVAKAFIPNPQNLPEVGHKDENSKNCFANNLEWTTHADNCNMPLRKQRISQNRSGIPHTKEWKDKMSLKNSGQNNPFYGNHSFAGENNPRAIKVICEGKIFSTIKECAQYYEQKNGHNLSNYLKHPESMPLIWKERKLAYYMEDKR